MINKSILTAMFISLMLFSLPTKVMASNNELFKERIVYFDRALDVEENFELLKKVIVKAKKLGFNALVLNQEYIYARLSHKNAIIDKVKKRFNEIEVLVHAQGLRLIVMHFNTEVPTFVVKDGDPGNPFYQEGKFDFSESNKAITKYLVKGDEAFVDAKRESVKSPSLFDGLYHFKNIKPNTEYKLTLHASTNNYKSNVLKVSVLDEDHHDENGKVIFGIQKFFRFINPNKMNGEYSLYFNSLNHKNLNAAIKIYLPKQDNMTVSSLEIKEVGYVKNMHVKRKDTMPMVTSPDGKKMYSLDRDYILEDDVLILVSNAIKSEKFLLLTWYPRIDVSRFYDHETTANICADEKLFHTIMIDQYQAIKSTMNGKVDGLAFNDDEWREAGWDEKCQKLYAKEYKQLNTQGGFTGGDYIGISTKRMVENLLKGEKSSMKTYVMSDMFDPNFNAKDPYMGVKDGAVGAIDYLPKETTVFNWFPNPHEPGLEDKTKKDFLKSAKHFADHGISQIIAGYHDDMRNLDANIAFYKESDKKTQESIKGFMFLIWNQPGKNPSYEDMDKVVKRICTELPGKWPTEGCR